MLQTRDIVQIEFSRLIGIRSFQGVVELQSHLKAQSRFNHTNSLRTISSLHLLPTMPSFRCINSTPINCFRSFKYSLVYLKCKDLLFLKPFRLFAPVYNDAYLGIINLASDAGTSVS